VSSDEQEQAKEINDKQVASNPVGTRLPSHLTESRLAGIIDSAIDAIITVNQDYKI